MKNFYRFHGFHQLVVTLCSFGIGTSALAHVERGTWTGTNPADGNPCSMQAIRTYFANDQHHPLNERVEVSTTVGTFTLIHPPVINAAESMAYFNHDQFQGILPTDAGADALVIEMSHAEGSEGPTAFTLIKHQWKGDVRTASRCEGLKLAH